MSEPLTRSDIEATIEMLRNSIEQYPRKPEDDEEHDDLLYYALNVLMSALNWGLGGEEREIESLLEHARDILGIHPRGL